MINYDLSLLDTLESQPRLSAKVITVGNAPKFS